MQTHSNVYVVKHWGFCPDGWQNTKRIIGHKNNDESSLRATVIQIEFHGNVAIVCKLPKTCHSIFAIITLDAVREIEETTINYYMMSSSPFQTVCTI